MLNPPSPAVHATKITAAAQVRTPAIERAFAAVPRERFLGEPPWRLDDGERRWTTGDPAELYGEASVILDEVQDIRSGPPQLWAFVLDRCRIAPGMSVIQVGAGTGYYTAILAELVGPAGRVVAFELSADLAERGRRALAPWPWATVLTGDAAELARIEAADLVLVACGVTFLPDRWLDRLPTGARIAAPFTGADQNGVMLLLTRRTAGFDAVPLAGVAIQPAAGLRDARQERQLDGVRRADPDALFGVRALGARAAVERATIVYGFGGHVFSSADLPV